MALIVGMVFATLVCGWRVHDARIAARMLRSPADAAARDSRLLDYATRIARPAYAANCARCHGADMRGDTAKGVPNLVDADWLYGEGDASEIERTLLYGVRSGLARSRNLADMPGFAMPVPYRRYPIPPLKPAQIDDVIAYLHQIEGRPAEPGAVTRGYTVFNGPGGCYDCHGEAGQGDPAVGAPDLTDAVWLYGHGRDDELRDIIGRGRAGVCPPWLGALSPKTIRALALYLHDRASRAAASKQTSR